MIPITEKYNRIYTQIEFIKEYVLGEKLDAAEVEKRYYDPNDGGDETDTDWAKYMYAQQPAILLLEQEIIKYIIDAKFSIEQYNETIKEIIDLYSSVPHIIYNNDNLLLILNIGSKKYYIKFTPHSFINRTQNNKLYKPFVIYGDGTTYKMIKYGCYDDELELEDIIQEQPDMTPEEKQIFASIHKSIMDKKQLLEQIKEQTRISQIETSRIPVKRIIKEKELINTAIYTDIIFNDKTYILSFTEKLTGAKYEIKYTEGYPFREPLFFYNNKKVVIDNNLWTAAMNILDIIEYINKKAAHTAKQAAAHTAEQAAAHTAEQAAAHTAEQAAAHTAAQEGGIRRKKYKFAY